MYSVKRRWITGYAILPCFKVKMLDGSDVTEMVCNPILEFIFQYLFAPFWKGKIHITGYYDEPSSKDLEEYIKRVATDGDLFPDLTAEEKAENRRVAPKED